RSEFGDGACELADAVGGDRLGHEVGVGVFGARRLLQDVGEDVANEVDGRAGEPGDIDAVIGDGASYFERRAEVVLEDGADEAGGPGIVDLAHGSEHIVDGRV